MAKKMFQGYSAARTASVEAQATKNLALLNPNKAAQAPKAPAAKASPARTGMGAKVPNQNAVNVERVRQMLRTGR